MAFWKFTGASPEVFPSIGITAKPGYVYDLGSATPPTEPLPKEGQAYPLTLSYWTSDPGPATDGRTGQATDFGLDPLSAVSQLVRFRKAVAATRAGTADTKVLWIGDSTASGFGSGATPPNFGSPSARLATLLNKRGLGPAAPGLACAPLTPDTDTRWTVGSGWVNFTNYGFGNQASWFSSAPGGTPLVYADSRVNADRFDVYYAEVSGFGTFTAQATGGSVSSGINTSTGAPGVSKVTVSAGSAATTNTVTITNTVGSVVVLYVEPWLSTTSTIRIGNAGRNGSSTAGWIDNTLGICSTASLTAYAANLYVLSLGINDAAASTPVATFRANMESIIATCQAAGGDVILWTPQAVNDPTREAVLATYRAVYPSIAAQHGCFFTDVHSRFPAYDAGWYSDNYHLNGAGYYDEAEMFAAALSGI